MGKLIKLDEPILTLDGRKIQAMDGVSDLTYRRGLVSILEFASIRKPGNGEMIRAFGIATKIYENKTPEIELADEDIVFIKEVLEQSRAFNLAVVIARLHSYLQASLNLKVEPSVSK